jgi:hypothetical protein
LLASSPCTRPTENESSYLILRGAKLTRPVTSMISYGGIAPNFAFSPRRTQTPTSTSRVKRWLRCKSSLNTSWSGRPNYRKVWKHGMGPRGGV